jgi:hypothetical protein
MADESANISFLFDTDISSYTCNSIKSIYETTWFNLVLHGIRNSFNRVIQSTTPIEFSFTDRYKELILKKTKNNLVYPYAFVVINDVEIVKDQINTSAMARRGLVNRKFSGTGVSVSYLFPFKMNITLNVLDSDINSLFSMVQSIFLSDVCRGFNFGIKAFDYFTKIKVTKTSGISFSDATISTEQENDFGTGHITCTFEVQGWMGFTALHPTARTLKINVYNVDEQLTEENASEVIENHSTLQCTYQLTLSEDSDGKERTDQLYIAGSG